MISQTPPVAQSRNWRSILLAAAGGGVLTASGIYWAMGDIRKPAVVETVRQTTAQDLRKPDFEPVKPAPVAPIPPPVVSTPAPKVVTTQPARTAAVRPPEPPKPLQNIFAMTTDGGAFGQQKGGPAAVADHDYRPGMSDGVDKLGDDQRQGLSAEKTRWLASAGTGGDDFVTRPFAPPISRYMIQAGTVIHATTTNEVNSDLPGDVVATISEDVHDTPTGNYVLIPALSRLYGRYNSQLSYGQTRAQIAWLRILFADGSSQNIGSMAGVDGSGAAGIEGNVDRHPWSMAGAVALTSAFTILSQTGAILQSTSGSDNGQTNIGIIGAGAAGQSAASIGGKVIDRELNRPNTLIIPQGSEVAVMVSKDIALPPR